MGSYVVPRLTLAACLLVASGLDMSFGNDEVPPDDVALLQTQVVHQSRRLETTKQKAIANGGEPVCKEMTNHGSYFTVTVEVGTPRQAFDIVADTGSNALIVPDCRCKLSGQGCKALDMCFDTDNSSSFLINKIMFSRGDKDKAMVPMFTLSYGSGDIDCTVASDEVAVGGVGTFLQDGIFLMESRGDLDIGGDFQGIFGMGLPGADLGLEMTEFLMEAGVSRYSMCFNADEPGVLRMNVPPLVNPMGNIGQVHWGLDLQGMSAGSASAPVLFCDPSTKKKHQQSACGAIPDSGTTLMMGPKDQIHDLYAGLCSAWPRCDSVAQNHTMVPRSRIFTELLGACDDWLDEAHDGILEVPPIILHLAGSDGRPRQVKLTAWSYVVKYLIPDMEFVKTHVEGLGDFEVIIPSDNIKTRCGPSIGEHEYTTRQNGPVWILGSPLFFENSLSYDISVQPPQIAINPGPCTTCKASLLDADINPRQVKRLPRNLRSLRQSSINRNRRL
mmetsp:Transcript_58137/g.101790  ORF Transcript_58137/g.101790 Transcript_58137/m.101790 type:complete len:501 (+) Transcript_58137:83-1585(+)